MLSDVLRPHANGLHPTDRVRCPPARPCQVRPVRYQARETPHCCDPATFLPHVRRVTLPSFREPGPCPTGSSYCAVSTVIAPNELPFIPSAQPAMARLRRESHCGRESTAPSFSRAVNGRGALSSAKHDSLLPAHGHRNRREPPVHRSRVPRAAKAAPSQDLSVSRPVDATAVGASRSVHPTSVERPRSSLQESARVRTNPVSLFLWLCRCSKYCGPPLLLESACPFCSEYVR